MIINQELVDQYLARFKEKDLQERIKLYWKSVEDSRLKYAAKPSAKTLKDLQTLERNILDYFRELDDAKGIVTEISGSKNDLNGTPLKKLRWEIFCQEYIKDFNGTRAYMSSGYSCTSAKARINASKLLTKENIQARIKELMEHRIVELHLDQTKYLQALDSIAGANAADYFIWDRKGNVTLRASHELTRIQTEAIGRIKQKINVDGSQSIEMEFHKKLEAINLLGKYLRLWDADTPPADPEAIAKKMMELQTKIDDTIEGPPSPQTETTTETSNGPDSTVH